MSEAVSKTLPVGPVRMYWNDVNLGSPKSQATIRYNKETVRYGLEDSNVEVGSHPNVETCEIDVVIADFKPDQFRYIFSQSESKASNTTIFADGYTSGIAFVHRMRDEVKLTGTVTVTLEGAGFESGTIKVFKTDLSNLPTGYVKGTDYTASSGTGNIKRIAAGSITDGETVYVEYNQSSTSAVAYVGGKLSDYEGELRLTHQLDNGKYMTIVASRAKRIGASEFAIQMANMFEGIPMTFVVLADMTNAPGKQLLDIGVES